MSTSIEWTDETWNPVTGCTRVSEGCRNCYMERQVPRQKLDPWTVTLHPHRLAYPLKMKKPKKIFVNSLSDLFHEDVPFDFIHHVFGTIRQTPEHIYQILTKRPARMLEVVSLIKSKEAMGWANGFYSHVWLGVSVEDQATADERIPLLLQTPAAVRFVSCEPLLGPVDLTDIVTKDGHSEYHRDALFCDVPPEDDEGWNGACLNWVIVGGESGPNARPMHPDWVRSIRDQCHTASVPFFFKQIGEWILCDRPTPDQDFNGGAFVQTPNYKAAISVFGENYKYRIVGDDYFYRTTKKKAGRQLDGQEYSAFPEKKESSHD